MGNISNNCLCNPKERNHQNPGEDDNHISSGHQDQHDQHDQQQQQQHGDDRLLLLHGKVIMKLQHAKRLHRDGLVELSRLAGHANYTSALADWAAVNRHANDQVLVFSYRHKEGLFGSTVGLGDRYLSANYGWALEYLHQKETNMEQDQKEEEGNMDEECEHKKHKIAQQESIAIGWLDILCTCHDGETLMDAFGYMGELYLNNRVVNNYMSTPQAFAEVQTRGWIYQESAFPAIDVQGWDDEAWGDISHYRIVADLILRRGFQGHVKTKALDLDDCKVELDKIMDRGKNSSERHNLSKESTKKEWWSQVDEYIKMICDPEGLGIVLDLHGLHKLGVEAEDPTIGMELQAFTNQCYAKIVTELKLSLDQQAGPSLLGYFAVGAIKAFLSSELAMETDRNSAVFGVLKELSQYNRRDEYNENENDSDTSILKFIWRLAYPKGEIIASPVRSGSGFLAGLGSVEAIEGDSIAPHIPHLSTFVPELVSHGKESGAKLYVGTKRTHEGSEEMEFSIEVLADAAMDVRAIRIIPKSYWNYDEVVARLPKSGNVTNFVE